MTLEKTEEDYNRYYEERKKVKDATHDHFFDYSFWGGYNRSRYNFELFIPQHQIPMLNHAEYICINYEMIVPLLDDFFENKELKEMEFQFQKYFVEVSEMQLKG